MKNQLNIRNFSACCFSTSSYKCLALCKLRKRLKATALRASTCSLSLLFPHPTSHLCDCCAICAQIVFFLTAGGARLTDSAFLLVLCPDFCCIACSMAVGTLCSVHPLLCIFILTLLTWSAGSSTSALVLVWSCCCCCQFPSSSAVWSGPHPFFQQTQVSFTGAHTSCQRFLFLWMEEAVDAVADRIACLVALTSQGCSELRRCLANC